VICGKQYSFTLAHPYTSDPILEIAVEAEEELR
jgi:hypothetical protein